MVMLAQAIILDKEIRNPENHPRNRPHGPRPADYGTFRIKCQIRVENATTEASSSNCSTAKSDAVITTIINKFETAVRGIRTR